MTQRDLWNDRYREKGALWGVEPNQFVAELLADLAPCRVLDLGSGQGRNAIWLAARGHRVTAVDVSDVAIEQAAEIAAGIGVELEFMTADLLQWDPPEGEFDLVLLAYIQAPDGMRQILHAKAAAALAPGGKVFLIAHHKDNLEHGIGGPPMLEMLFDESVASDFPDLEIEENGRVTRIAEKDGVEGAAIDLLLVATKP